VRWGARDGCGERADAICSVGGRGRCVIVRDTLPAGVTYVSSSGGNYNSTTGAWTVGSLGNGGSTTLTIVVLVGQTGSIQNTAEVAASDQRDPLVGSSRRRQGSCPSGAGLSLPPDRGPDRARVARP
jgi:Domain of unknown function DUF11